MRPPKHSPTYPITRLDLGGKAKPSEKCVVKSASASLTSCQALCRVRPTRLSAPIHRMPPLPLLEGQARPMNDSDSMLGIRPPTINTRLFILGNSGMEQPLCWLRPQQRVLSGGSAMAARAGPRSATDLLRYPECIPSPYSVQSID